ncbi:MAG: PSD1 and planctomycete cytochrome C domain-containing protein [Verrucomicrobiales bacterium]|nr:PSD1 and planctomycete cytochrome C domain-containing protein [Verrucomicrobiales bacterium]
MLRMFFGLRLLPLLVAGLGCPLPLHADGDKGEVGHHDIVPVMQLRCTVCHGARKQEAGLDLRTPAGMLRGGESGPAFIPGKPGESLILKKIHDGEMPPRRKLVAVSVKTMQPHEIELLTRWIALGAPMIEESKEEVMVPGKKEREFWAFRQPVAPEVPLFKGSAISNPVDAFILQELKKKGLDFSPMADKRTLIRRVSFDLTGLPPSPVEVQEFLSDKRPDAYPRLIERLLDSPRYGERWGRYWLDAAGYSDSDGGQDSDPVRDHAWRYRDYVIGSFNSDKPYDRFLMEQLAGDELAEPGTVPDAVLADNLVATGFLRMGMDYTFANITGFVPDRIEVIDREMEVMSGTVLGLSMKCAKCHDHKFDPIPQKDYFRLLAIFKGAYDEHDWMRPREGKGGAAYAVPWPTRYLPVPGAHEQWKKRNEPIQQQIDDLKKDRGEEKNKEAIKALEDKRGPEPLIRALWDRGEPSTQYVLSRGDYRRPGEPVGPGVPLVLRWQANPYSPSQPWPKSKKTGRRLAFARWLTHPDHPLTARVMVNRIWKHHFTRGIVDTLDNFGKAGSPPTHPGLLDWLAVEFVRQGWSVKAMHRMIMSSRTYRQSSRVSAQAADLDPDNRLLSRMPLRRLDAEALRDSLIFVAGQLDEQSRGGPPDVIEDREDGLVSVPRGGQGWRRSVYVLQRRTKIPTFLSIFDLPRMEPNCVQRPESTVALQALHLLNDGIVHQLAGHFSQRLMREAEDLDSRIRLAYMLALSRLPSDAEMGEVGGLVRELEKRWQQESGENIEPVALRQKAFANLCRILFNVSEFQYVD